MVFGGINIVHATIDKYTSFMEYHTVFYWLAASDFRLARERLNVGICYEMMLPVHQTTLCHITESVNVHQHHCDYLKYRMKELVNALCGQNETHIKCSTWQ